jgi:hypothetical protein
MGQWAIERMKIFPAPIESSGYIGARDIVSALPYAGCDSVKRKLN